MSCDRGMDGIESVGMQCTAPVQHVPPSKYGRRKHFSHKIAGGLGVSQVVLGGVLIMIGIVSVVVKTQLYFIGAPYWCGTLFAITGAICCVSAYKKTTSSIIASLVLSIISSAVSGIVLLVIAAIALHLENYYNDCFDHLHSRGHYICTMETIKGRMAVNGAIIIIAFIEAVLSIMTSVFCCRALCCADSGAPVVYFFATQPDHAAHHQVPMATVTQGKPAVVMIPQGVQLVSQGTPPPRVIHQAPQIHAQMMSTPTGTPTHRLVAAPTMLSQPVLPEGAPPTDQSPPPSYASGSDQTQISPSVGRVDDNMKAPLLSEP